MAYLTLYFSSVVLYLENYSKEPLAEITDKREFFHHRLKKIATNDLRQVPEVALENVTR